MPPNPAIDHLAIVRAARDTYDSLSGTERAWKTTNAVALRLRALGEDAGLFWKGNVGTNYQGYSVDVVMYQTTETYDCLVDAEGTARPNWAPTTPTGHGPASAWRPPVGTVPVPSPSPSPPPGPSPSPSAPSEGPCDLTPVLQAIADLDRKVTLFQQDVLAIKRQVTRPWTIQLRLPYLGTAVGTNDPPTP